MVGVTGLALLFTLYLTALEIFVIHALCRYCLVSAGIVLVMFTLAVSYLREMAQGPEHKHADLTQTEPAEPVVS